MEESEKTNGRKKLPSIPDNYVTLVQLQERWVKERKHKEKEENQDPEQEQGEKENQGEERGNAKVDGRRNRKNGRFGRRDRENWKRVANRKPNEEESAVALAVNESEGVEEEKEGDKLKNKKKKWKKKKKNKEEKAGAEYEGEVVVGTTANAPLPASVECNKGKEETIADEVHEPKQESAEEENVEARTVEIGRKIGGMSMKGENRKYWRQRGGNRELNGSYHGNFDRRRERNQTNERMVWVKKGEGNDGNVGGIQS